MLHVLAVVDGRPGHGKQTLGIVAALRRRCEVELTSLKVECDAVSQLKDLVALFLPRLSRRWQSIPGADLILCTGGKTHLTALTLGRRFAVPVCTCMTPGHGFRHLFSLCFIPVHDRVPPAENIISTLGAPVSCVDRGRHEEGKGLICIGGLNPWLEWDEAQLLSQLGEVLKGEGHWVVTNSPRTPESTSEAVVRLCGKYGVQFFYWKETEQGWIERQYDLASEVWLTSDSISMLYEALSSGCRVNIFSIRWKDPQGKHAYNEKMLKESGYVRTFADWCKGEPHSADLAVLNEAQRCADIILEKWWPEN
ncbi:mitochondrial fission ELM1 family protein [Desulforhopalus vacuolatus]|uniref:ELM1/GtrOC1 family putative glycosyltransferase n=1 Tax=Desulforhopalus vacuolatus TaxID=40414 RepID=UPI001963F150|nr:mitochondrial fission ELM1 family protein [Desulforhopalus vacuolatus]